MASSGHFGNPLEVTEVAYINSCITSAEDNGLECEWWGTFIAGVRQGLSTRDAAYGACNEWDV